MSDKKFYWLKLKKDFFKRHDIKIISRMEDGNEIILFYLKLMLESVDHEGELRFSETIPYSTKMLASITDTSPEIAEKALEALTELGLVTINEDKTIIVENVTSMLGFETKWAKEKAEWREKKRQEKDTLKTEIGQIADNVQTMSRQCPTRDRDRVRDRDRDKERNIKERKFSPPTLQEVQSYCQERNNNVDPKTFFDYYSSNNWKDSKGNPVKNWKQKLITWENHETKQRTEPSRPKFGITQEEIDSVMEKFRREGQ